VRVALPFGEGETPAAAVVPSLPDAAAVVRSWAAQGRRGLQVSLPPGRLADAIEATRSFVLLAAGGDDGDRSDRGSRAAALATALHGWGLVPEAAMASAAASGRRGAPRGAARAVAAAGSGDPTVEAARLKVQQAWREIAAADPAGLGHLREVLDDASPSWGWPMGPEAQARHPWPGAGDDGWARACLLAAARDLLVCETGTDPLGRRGLALCSVLPPEWLGQSIDVTDAPTELGSISYAVRWHGARPALLWELTPAAGVGPLCLVSPGLDPSWSSDEPAGEALLAPPAGAPATA
jgi:hypothetical protein